MSGLIRKLRPARRDLVDIFYHYARNGSVTTARRFLAETEATLHRLAGMPGLGTLYEPSEPAYAGLRYFLVSRFRMYVIFYRPIPDGIEVLRVLHGARDIAGILAVDFGIESDAGDDDTEADESSGSEQRS